MALFRIVPGLRLAAPRDGTRLRQQLAEALEIDDAPTVVRFPSGPAPSDIPAQSSQHGVDVLKTTDGTSQVLLISIGAEARTALDAAALLGENGIGVKVVDPQWVYPLNGALVGLAADADLIVTVEDGLVNGGVGQAVARLLAEHNLPARVINFGLPARFLAHGSRAELASLASLTAAQIARRTMEALEAPNQTTSLNLANGSKQR